MYTKFNPLRAVLFLAVLCVSVSAFGSSAGSQSVHKQAVGKTFKSPLFHATTKSSSLNFGISNVISTTKMNPLLMAEDDEVEKSEEKKKEQSGFLTALLLAPPLFAKFIIVLVVKFLTDVIVYPFLFLYRAVRRAKNKTKSVLEGDDETGPSTAI